MQLFSSCCKEANCLVVLFYLECLDVEGYFSNYDGEEMSLFGGDATGA